MLAATCCMPTSVGTAASLSNASEPLGLPLITSFHGRDVYSPGWGWRKGSARSIFSDLFEKGSGFTCVGPNAREELIRNGCPSELLDVVKVGVDLSTFPFRARRTRRPLVILQIARLTEKKGVDLTLRAYARARPDLGEAELWIVGDGHLRRPLVTLSQDLGIGDSVRFLGALPHNEVRDLLARAHIGVQPSRTAKDGDKEGSPTVLLEMQAAGLPVVASDHADISSIVAYPEELVEEDDWVGVANALVRVAGLSDSERIQRAAAGRELIEREHDVRQIARQLEIMYREISQRFHSPST